MTSLGWLLSRVAPGRPSHQIGEWAGLSGGLGGQARDLVSRALRAKQTGLLCEGGFVLITMATTQGMGGGEAGAQLPFADIRPPQASDLGLPVGGLEAAGGR